MPKIIVTRPDRQILPVREIVEHPNDVHEVVLTGNTDTQKFLIWSIERRMYWKERWEGYTEDLDEAHRYPYNEALLVTRSSGQSRSSIRNVMIPAP